jgi:hypothetical protein
VILRAGGPWGAGAVVEVDAALELGLKLALASYKNEEKESKTNVVRSTVLKTIIFLIISMKFPI